MAKRYINVVTKHPGEDFCDTRIENTLEALQDFVGGYIETVTINNSFVIICNEEGRLQHLDHCISFHGDLLRGDLSFYGPIIFAAIRGEDFDDFELSYAVELLYMAYKMIPQECQGDKIDAFVLYQKFVTEAVRRDIQRGVKKDEHSGTAL